MTSIHDTLVGSSVPASQVTFYDFIFKDRQNRKYLFIALGGMVVQLILFKVLYPFADYFSDSYSYIETAVTGANVNIWPVGYSKILYAFHLLSHSDTALVAFQYLFVGCSLLLFFFTLRYWYSPSGLTVTVLYVFMFFNPLLLYVSNYISSDALFMGLSVIWLTLLLWVIQRPKMWYLWPHALIIAVAFTMRYNAMYYPLISIVAFLLSGYKWRVKAVGILLPIVLIGAFVVYTREKSLEVTGTRQFSVFSGWQWGNNALYMYAFIDVDRSKLPPQTLEFDTYCKNYFDTIPDEMKAVGPIDGGAWYIRYGKAPLKRYLAHYLRVNKLQYDGVASWGAVAPIYGAHGSHLAKEHPGAYFRYFLLPNTVNYFLPPLEKLEVYNLGMNELLDPIAQQWFEYKSMQVSAVSFKFQGSLLHLFPSVFLLINLGFMVVLVAFIAMKGYKRVPRDFCFVLLLIVSLFVINMGFSILASPVVFRYQVFPLIVYLSFCLLVYERIDVMSKEDEALEKEKEKAKVAVV